MSSKLDGFQSGAALPGAALQGDTMLGSPIPVGTKQASALSGPTVRFTARYLGISAGFYLSIMTLVMIAITVLLNIFEKDNLIPIGDGELAVGILAYDSMLTNSNPIFLFVTGICLPFMMEVLLSNGVTRKQFSLALLVTALGFSVVLVLFQVLAAVLLGNFDLLTLGVCVVSNFCAWLLGWMIALGFQLRRVVTAIAGILIACVATVVISVPVIFVSSNWLLSLDALPLLEFAITLAITIILAVALPALSKRVPIKC